jgi:hypothetical protein
LGKPLRAHDLARTEEPATDQERRLDVPKREMADA